MVEPMVDVSSVTIFPTNLSCAVYGDIFARDKFDSTLPTYELYRRDGEHVELISEPGQALSIVGLDNVLLMQHPVMSFALRVKDSRAEDDAFIARGTVSLDIQTNNDYEEVKQLDIKGDCGHATVNYITMSCAIVADTKVRLYDYWDAIADGQQKTVSQQDSNLKCSLFGSIVAHYGETFGHTDQFCIPLLNVPSHQSIPLFFEGHPMPTVKLTRNCLAVPAYSSLNIKANLKLIASSMSVLDEEDTVILWPPISSRLEDHKIPERSRSVFRTLTNWLPLSLLQSISRHTMKKSLFCGGEILLEVFSVFIGRKNNHNLDVSGTITLEPFDSRLVIFDRDDTNPDKLLNGRKLLAISYLSSPLKFSSESILLTIRVELKDASRGFLIEDCIHFDTTIISNLESNFNTRLCSVLRGKNGYCTVHYTMFMSATRVSLKIILLCKGVSVARVHGKIVAWSDIFDYTRDYDKKYYQRILYDKPKAQIYYPQKAAPKTTMQSSLDECNYGEVELSESCVAVPIDFSFNIGVDLYASSHTRSGLPEHLHKTFQLQYDKYKQMKKIHISGGDFVLCIQEF